MMMSPIVLEVEGVIQNRPREYKKIPVWIYGMGVLAA
jgi:hypothetical protein